MKYIKLNKINTILFLVVFIYVCTYLLMHTGAIWLSVSGGDAGETLKIAQTFFSANPYHSYVEYRGFLWGMLQAILYKFSMLLGFNKFAGYILFTGLELAYLLVVGVPAIMQRVINNTISYRYRLALIVSFFYFSFFYSIIVSLLVDITCVTFLVASLHCLLETQSIRRVFMSGLLISLVLLMRSNYILVVPLMALIMFKSASKKYISLLIFFVPMIILLNINNFYVHQNSQAIGFTGNGVLISQLTLGVYQQGMISNGIVIDKDGVNILKIEQSLNSSSKVYDGGYNQLSLKEYCRLYIRYPVFMLEMNIRHFLLGIDIGRFGSAFLISNVLLTKLIDYLVSSLFMVLLILNRDKFKNLQSLILSLCFILPSLSTTPFRIETRYFLSMKLFMISFVIMSLTRESLIRYKSLKNYSHALLIIFVLIFMVILIFADNEVSSNLVSFAKSDGLILLKN